MAQKRVEREELKARLERWLVYLSLADVGRHLYQLFMVSLFLTEIKGQDSPPRRDRAAIVLSLAHRHNC